MRCPEFADSELYVFADGARSPSDVPAVSEVREIVGELLGDRARLKCATYNLGLARSIIQGVGDLCEKYGKVIVVEDDLVVAPRFLEFLNGALERYGDDDRVMQISAHMYPIEELEPQNRALFLPFTTSWGWATWSRSWNHFDESAAGWNELLVNRELRMRFDLQGAFSATSMLRRQMTGKLDSWAIRWYWSVFRKGGVILFPPKSLVWNAGFDGSGTHGGVHIARYAGNLLHSANEIIFPELVEVDPCNYERIRRVVAEFNPSVRNRLRGHVNRILLPMSEWWRRI